ncbi:DUF2795 domain-containing protein [Candidatus Microgenomates bacterium]|nr:DUF2795 domain-containing protein [Candidatus Microgenomates bacterium]
MTIQQWEKHTEHLKEHIAWPATKEQILEACKGEDVEPEVLKDIEENLPAGSYENESAVKELLVKE